MLRTIKKLSKLLKDDDKIYLTLLSTNSYSYKHKIKTNNNLYIAQKELAQLLINYIFLESNISLVNLRAGVPNTKSTSALFAL